MCIYREFLARWFNHFAAIHQSIWPPINLNIRRLLDLCRIDLSIYLLIRLLALSSCFGCAPLLTIERTNPLLLPYQDTANLYLDVAFIWIVNGFNQV